METKSAQPERLRAVTLIFRFPAGLGTLRIHAGCRASSGLFPQPLLISCYSVVVKLVYHRFLAKSTIFRCAVQTVCTKVGQMRQRVWFWRRAFPIGGRWPSEARSDEGEACAVSRKRDIAGNAALIRPLRGQLSPMGKPFSVISIPRSAEQRSSLSASGRREGSSGQCSSRSACPHGPCSCS